ncbi:MAG: hypothetical protein H0Z40_01335 [Desulfotomaculum sp.]|nr:hypothetical protein [Desulfotomaculum sp.]
MMKFYPGQIVTHLFRDIGVCTVIEYSTTVAGWPVVVVQDSTGQQYQFNEMYLRRVKNYERSCYKTPHGITKPINGS